MRPLVIIPARRGSKRVREKNIIDLGGRPMLAYTIEAALQSGIADSVYVSTEDSEIGRIAESFGAAYHHRPVALSGDLVSATDVCLETAERLQGQGDHFDAIVCLQPSSPLRNSEDIRQSWSRFLSTGADFLVSVTPIDPHFFHWAMHETSGGWQMFFGDKYLMERPLLPPVFRPNGAIKIGKTENLKATGNFFGDRLEVYTMPDSRSVHVAEPSDLQLATCFLQARRINEGKTSL